MRHLRRRIDDAIGCVVVLTVAGDCAAHGAVGVAVAAVFGALVFLLGVGHLCGVALSPFCAPVLKPNLKMKKNISYL